MFGVWNGRLLHLSSRSRCWSMPWRRPWPCAWSWGGCRACGRCWSRARCRSRCGRYGRGGSCRGRHRYCCRRCGSCSGTRCRCSRRAAYISENHDRIVKPARWEADRRRDIESAITIKISHCPKKRRVSDTVPLVRAQAAVRVCDKDRHIIRCVVKHHEIRGSIAVHVTRFQVVADPQIFQNTRTGLRSYRLKGSVTIPQSRPNQVGAEGRLLQDHGDIEQAVPVKISHFKLERSGGTDNWSSKRKISVSRKHTHTVWQGSYNVDVAIAGYIRQSQPARQSTGKHDIGHSSEFLVSVIPENENVRLDSRTGFFFSQHNVEVAVAIGIGSIDRSVTTGKDLRHNGWSECSVAEIQRRAEMKRRKISVGRKDEIHKTVAVDISQLHVGELSGRCVINRGSECAVTVILQNFTTGSSEEISTSPFTTISMSPSLSMSALSTAS